MFSICTVPLVSKEAKVGSSDQEVSPSTVKNTEVVLVSHRTWKLSLQLFLVLGILPTSQSFFRYKRRVFSEAL